MKNLLSKAALVGVGLTIGLVVAPSAVEAAVHYLSSTKTVQGLRAAPCPAGYQLTGGGTAPLPPDVWEGDLNVQFRLTSSYPSGAAWKATAVRTATQYSADPSQSIHNSFPYDVTVYAICAH